MTACATLEPKIILLLAIFWIIKLIKLLSEIWRVGIALHTSAKFCVWNTFVYLI